MFTGKSYKQEVVKKTDTLTLKKTVTHHRSSKFTKDKSTPIPIDDLLHERREILLQINDFNKCFVTSH
jgi:hypothetical protein